jgi:hypothetical protein
VATKAVQYETAPAFAQKCYVLNGITYVPHYSKDCFVGPGYGQSHRRHVYEATLDLFNAKPEVLMLWERERK